jgi:hypothetical protein
MREYFSLYMEKNIRRTYVWKREVEVKFGNMSVNGRKILKRILKK